jgi:hypothetical protein
MNTGKPDQSFHTKPLFVWIPNIDRKQKRGYQIRLKKQNIIWKFNRLAYFWSKVVVARGPGPVHHRGRGSVP